MNVQHPPCKEEREKGIVELLLEPLTNQSPMTHLTRSHLITTISYAYKQNVYLVINYGAQSLTITLNKRSCEEHK
jgi:hypothetical protein